MVYSLAVRADSQVQFPCIEKEVRVLHKELRNQLLHIARVSACTLPLFMDALEKSIRVVVLASLEFDHPLGIRSHKETNNIPWSTVVRPVQVLLLVWHLEVAGSEI